ncbi:MAG: MerR family transcriptional regulator [Candidatus Binatia bacterium]
MAQAAVPDAGKRHPIQVVARRTGVNVELLRAWERRYHVVEPSRQESGKRLYSDSDIDRITLLRRVVERGLRIKAAAEKTNEELAEFLREHDVATAAPTPAARSAATGDLLAQCRASVADCDGDRLERLIEGARADLALPVWTDDFLAPLISWVGQAWSDGELRIYQEHLATAVLRGCIAHGLGVSRGDVATIVVATLSGESHELGALLAAVSAAAAGWRVEFLGTDLPAGEIAAAVKRFGARAIALSVVLPARDGRAVEDARLLRRLVGPEVAIFAGGKGVSALEAVLQEADIRTLERPSLLAKALSSLPL